MPIFKTFWDRFYSAIVAAEWKILAGIFILHMMASWALMTLAGESELTENRINWIYYYTVTATTVGYGDMSPSGDIGRILNSLFVLPGAIGLFTVMLGKGISDIGERIKARLMGKGDYTRREGHVIIMGWQGERTRRLIEAIINEKSEEQAKPVLVCRNLETNPEADKIDYIGVETLSDVGALIRSGAKGAKSIIVRGDNDDETLAATLAALSEGTQAHVVAYFEEEQAAKLLKNAPGNLGITLSVSNDIMVRASCDPGTSALSQLLFSGSNPDTAYSLTSEWISGKKLSRYHDAPQAKAWRHPHRDKIERNGKAGSQLRQRPGNRSRRRYLLYFRSQNR